MAALHILGNGFDLHHGLPTSYVPHLREIVLRSERFVGEWESYSDSADLWADVEENLAYPDSYALVDHLESWAPDLLSDRESDRDGIIYEAEQLLHFPLDDFAERADAAVEKALPSTLFQQLFGPSDHFLSFNYTHTLERLYDVDPSRILHLHGEVGGQPLIFGFAPGQLEPQPRLHDWESEENFDFYRSSAHDVLERRLLALEKKYQMGRLEEFVAGIRSQIDGVFVYGFSFGRVDGPYFEHLAQQLPQATWTILGYNADALDEACSRLDEYNCGIVYERRVLGTN